MSEANCKKKIKIIITIMQSYWFDWHVNAHRNDKNAICLKLTHEPLDLKIIKQQLNKN
jgi:hypothetical protein